MLSHGHNDDDKSGLIANGFVAIGSDIGFSLSQLIAKKQSSI